MILAAAATEADPTSVVLQYGLLGVVALILFAAVRYLNTRLQESHTRELAAVQEACAREMTGIREAHAAEMATAQKTLLLYAERLKLGDQRIERQDAVLEKAASGLGDAARVASTTQTAVEGNAELLREVTRTMTDVRDEMRRQTRDRP